MARALRAAARATATKTPEAANKTRFARAQGEFFPLPFRKTVISRSFS
jgi:hypothetical protein